MQTAKFEVTLGVTFWKSMVKARPLGIVFILSTQSHTKQSLKSLLQLMFWKPIVEARPLGTSGGDGLGVVVFLRCFCGASAVFVRKNLQNHPFCKSHSANQTSLPLSL